VQTEERRGRLSIEASTEGAPALEEVQRLTTRGSGSTSNRARGRASVSAIEPDPLGAAIEAACTGDEAAFAVVWRALHPPLLRYLRVRGDEAPEDLASETWMAVVRGLAGFEGGAAEFKAWLFTIARNRAIDHARARARRPRAVPVAEPVEMGRTEVEQSAEHHAVLNDATARALRLVASLPAMQAEMVMLRVVAGLDVADVARLLDKKPGTVRVTVHRALQALARDPRAHSAREVV
jgi:RNA polymerase sigma-70 factor (ECF subfamily)